MACGVLVRSPHAPMILCLRPSKDVIAQSCHSVRAMHWCVTGANEQTICECAHAFQGINALPGPYDPEFMKLH